MACALTQGFALDCMDSMGGLKDFLVTPYVAAQATVTAGEITAIANSGSVTYYRYEIDNEEAGFETATATDRNTGTTISETTLTLLLKKLSSTKNVELGLLSMNRLSIIVQDNNGVYHSFGYDNGSNVSTNTSGSGTAFGDLNGYTVEVMTKENHKPYTVDATVVAGLTIV